jgi:type IV pilus assembly protein PilQ
MGAAPRPEINDVGPAEAGRYEMGTDSDQLERVESMTAHIRDGDRRSEPPKRIATVVAAAAMAAATSMLLSAAATPVKLVGVSAQGNAVLIEATEPVAYSVNRPDPLTVVVDMRNVSVSDAKNDVAKQGPIAGVRLEQANSVDGRSVARVHLSLTKPSEYRVRSARNTIRVELSPADAATPIAPIRRAEVEEAPAPKPAVDKTTAPAAAKPMTVSATSTVTLPSAEGGGAAARMLETVRTNRSGETTTVVLAGDGLLTPARVTESENAPRRLVLDFPNVGSKAPAQTDVDSALVKKVRVGLNSHEPLVTRVVMEIDPAATYHVERAGDGGRDLAVVFGRTQAPATVMLAPQEIPGGAVEPEPPISMEQAIANAASITSPAAGPVTTLVAKPEVAASPAPAAAPSKAPAPSTPADPMSALNLVGPPVQTKSEPVTPRQTPLVAPPMTRSSAAAQAPIPTPPAPQVAPPATAAAPPPPQQQPVPSRPVVTAQTAPPTQPAQGQPLPGQAEKKYTGHPISMDFQGVDLRAVLRAFAEPSGLNFIIDPDVQGSVDMVLTEVPWDQALEVILRANQLDYTVDGTIVRIARIETLKRENDSRQALAKSVADAGQLQVRTFALSYARATAAAPLIKKAALSPRGDVQIDDRTNTLIITDLPAKLDQAANLISTIDRAEPQVEVEARIVQTTRDFARALGVQWGLNGRVMPDLGNTTSLAFPNRGTLGGRLGTQSPVDPRATNLEQTGSVINMGVPDASTAIGLALGAVNGAFNLDVALSALERTGKGRVLSTPRLTTQNNIEAEVAQGIQIPIQTVANNTVTVSFKDAVLVLKVTPQITAANTVIMRITIENATPDFSRQVNGIPPIDTQRANTQVQIDDGATTVIGGIFVSQEQTSSERTPGLHRLPLLGWLFKRDRVEDESRELLIFITPRILKG